MVVLIPVKEQIISAQVKCFSLSLRNKLKRSSSRSIRIKKLKEKIRWLNSYFFDSVLSSRPDGRKFRKLIVTHFTKSHHSCAARIKRNSPVSKKYVSIRKRRRFRPSKKIHNGPYCAPSGLTPRQVDDNAGITTHPEKVATNSEKADIMTHSEIRKPCGQAPLDYNPIMNSKRSRVKFNSKFPFHLSKLQKPSLTDQNSKYHDLPKAKYIRVLVSKRLAMVARKTSKYIPMDSVFKSKPPLKPLRSLLIHDLDGYLTPCWVNRLKPVQRESQSIITWARKIQQQSLLRSLGCNPNPLSLPSKFKLLKVPLNDCPRPSKYIKPWLRRKLKYLFPPRSPVKYTDSSLSSLAFINSFRPSPSPSPPTLVDYPLLVDRSSDCSPNLLTAMEPHDNLPPTVVDDTPPLVEYWSDSSSDNSDDLNILNASHIFEFVGSGPKVRKVKKDGKTVAGAFRPLSSYWPVYPNHTVRPLAVSSHTNPTNIGSSISVLTDHRALPTQNSSAPSSAQPLNLVPHRDESDCHIYPARSTSDLVSSPNPNLQPIDRNALKAVAAAISRDALSIIREMDMAVVALGSHGRASILYSPSLLKHWVLLCGSRSFPPISGNTYPLSIDPKIEGSSTMFKVVVEDFGTILFYHSCDQSIFKNMWPILTALKSLVIEEGPSGFPIKDEIVRADILRAFTEKYRCFFIAPGRATNINPVLLMDEFKAEAISCVTKNPELVKEGSPYASPLWSLFLHGSYIEEALLEVIFPDILKKFRVVIYANSDLGVSALSYQQKLDLNLTVVSLFIQDSEHYTVLLDNRDLRHVPVRTVSRDSPLPSWDYPLPPSPFFPIDHSHFVLDRPKTTLDPAVIQVILEENDSVSKFSSDACYSSTLSRKIVSSFSQLAPRALQKHLRFAENPRQWKLNSFADISKPFPQSTDLGFSLLSNPDFNLESALDDPICSDVMHIQHKIISRSNRCFVIHIAACLGIHPLMLEADLIDGAIRLLSCKDCHHSKCDILKSILSQDHQVNADILKLVFPPCLDGAIIRIVKIRDCAKPIKAIAYRQGQGSPITREANLLLFNGHFSILSDISFLKMIKFNLFSKSANIMIGSSIVDDFVAHRFVSPVIAPLTSVTNTQVLPSYSCSSDDPPPRNNRVCPCGGTEFEQTLNCLICFQCDLHIVLSPLVQPIDDFLPRTEDSLETYTDEGESSLLEVIPDVSPPPFSLVYRDIQTQIISHIMDFLWFFFNNISYSGRRSPHKDLSFQCFSPVYHMPPVPALNEDSHLQPHLSSVDIFLKYDCHILSRQLETFLCIHMIPKLPSYEFISGDGLAPLSQIMRAYSPQVSHPISYIIFDCRFPSTIPGSLSNILSDFFDGFISFNCCRDIKNQFNSRKSVLSEAINKSLQRLPSVRKPLLTPWPIVPPKMVIESSPPGEIPLYCLLRNLYIQISF